MRVISKSRLREFWEKPGHADSEGPLRAWYTHVNNKSVSWGSWGDVKAEFATASLVGDCIVYNIGGNKYRLVTRIRYPSQTVFTLKVMTHAEYDEDRWKAECGCFESPPPEGKEVRAIVSNTPETTIGQPAVTEPARALGRPNGTEKRRTVEMATTKAFRLKGRNRDSYLDLVLDFPLASIQSRKHLQRAQQVIDRLLATGKLDGGEQLYLDALSDLVAAYEDAHHAIEPASDADMLRHFMDAKGVTQAQISRETGLAKSSISEVLAGKKPFSRQMIRTLAEYFHIERSVLAGNL
jgi:mRNA-degrading endonuclease HigB of HigAB toxin-antitoxin module/antitoxin component HigA of HigAB toxin-antitoxin module